MELQLQVQNEQSNHFESLIEQFDIKINEVVDGQFWTTFKLEIHSEVEHNLAFEALEQTKEN